MPDGTYFSMERKKPALKANVVPSIFPKKVLEYAHFLGERKVPDNVKHSQKESGTFLQQPSTDCPLSLHGLNKSSSKVDGDPNYFSKACARFETQTISQVSAKEKCEKTKVEEKVKFIKVCEELNHDPNSVPLPRSGVWLSNVVNTPAFQCIMWSLWSDDASKVKKQIVLKPDMTISVSSIF